MSTYVGRQPIFDKKGICFGYELLYRSSDSSNSASFKDNATATARVIINLIHNIGLAPIIGHKKGFVNVDESILFNDAILLLPKEHFCFEILEHTKLSVALFERIKHLHRLGYRFSLDDFDCTDEHIRYYEPLFPFIDIIKVDIQAIDFNLLPQAVSKVKSYNIPLLAEKIETHQEYDTCLSLDFKYYQGYFFEKPIILSGNQIEPSTMNAIRLINCLQNKDDPNFIADQFSTCPDLVYNLLRHVNSGAYHFRQKITSIKQMVVLLGPKRIRSWLGLFLYGAPHERPFGGELFNNAKFRAKMMENLMLTCNKSDLAQKAFLTGSLSLIDAYLNIPMDVFLKNIDLDDEIAEALLYRKGVLGELLFIATEMNHAHDIQEAINALGHTPCFSMEQLHEACVIATLFVEETEHDEK